MDLVEGLFELGGQPIERATDNMSSGIRDVVCPRLGRVFVWPGSEIRGHEYAGSSSDTIHR